MSAGDGITYVPYQGAQYPTWSLPALEAAKCVELQGPEAFDRVHFALYEAFFTRSRNIGDAREVIAVVSKAGVDTEKFLADYRSGVGRQAVIRDYTAAAEAGVTSIPTVIFPTTGRGLTGLADLAQYRAAFEEAARC